MKESVGLAYATVILLPVQTELTQPLKAPLTKWKTLDKCPRYTPNNVDMNSSTF